MAEPTNMRLCQPGTMLFTTVCQWTIIVILLAINKYYEFDDFNKPKSSNVKRRKQQLLFSRLLNLVTPIFAFSVCLGGNIYITTKMFLMRLHDWRQADSLVLNFRAKGPQQHVI